MTAPMIESHLDGIYQLTLPLPRLRALLLRELGTRAAEGSACRKTMSTLIVRTDVDSLRQCEVAEAAAHRAEDAIAEIEDALARLDEGDYGTCERCGVAISIDRLEAHPQARRCIDCLTAPLR